MFPRLFQFLQGQVDAALDDLTLSWCVQIARAIRHRAQLRQQLRVDLEAQLFDLLCHCESLHCVRYKNIYKCICDCQTDIFNSVNGVKMRILAIDPGMNGAACVYTPQFSVASGMRWHVIDLPTVGDGSQRRINATALRDFIMKLTPDCSFIESVGAMPKQGVASSFRFGHVCGVIEGVVACCGIPITYVHSTRWKKFHGLRGPDKEQSRLRALQLAPELSPLLERKRDHGRAEAALLALFASYLNTSRRVGSDPGVNYRVAR